MEATMRRTIRSSGEIDSLFRTGKKATNELLLVMCGPTADRRGPQGRVAFIAGKKLGGAVVRNRAKRVLRAAVARLHGPWEGWDVLVVARPELLQAGSASIDAALVRALRDVGIVRE
jgi:ribonuclease P protein component